MFGAMMEQTVNRELDREQAGLSGKDARRRALQLPVTLLGGVALWWALTEISGLPAFIFPGPADVWRAFLRVASDGTLALHTWVTLSEVLLGLALGVVVATVLGYALAKSTNLERIMAPYIVASQAIPIVAIAPLLIIWFGPGMLSKVLVSALIVFFPVLVNTIVGVRSVPDELYDLMRSLRAGRWQTFVKLEVPASLPVLIGGLKVGATLSVIGAVVGEFVGADRGLGFLINLARGMYDTPLVFVAIMTLIALALALYGSVNVLESWVLSWGRPRQESVTGPILEET